MTDDFQANLGRNEYNSFVQLVQSEARSFGMESRVRAVHLEHGRIDGVFEVFWDRWQELATETQAMTPEAYRTTYPNRWDEIQAQAAVSIAQS